MLPSYQSIGFTPRTDNRFPVHDLDLPGRVNLFPILYDLAPVAGWERYNLHDLAHDPWVGSALYTDPEQHIVTAGCHLDLDDLDRDLSDLICPTCYMRYVCMLSLIHI